MGNETPIANNETPDANNETPIVNISLRDYFATQAMNAFISYSGSSVLAVDRAYRVADEMMWARTHDERMRARRNKKQ